MKAYPILLFTCFLLGMANCKAGIPKNSDLPEKIQSYLSKNYPEAKEVHWLSHENHYLLSFWNGPVHVEVYLNNEGEDLKEIREIGLSDTIPTKMKMLAAQGKLINAEKLELEDGELFYIFEISASKGMIEEIIYDNHFKEIKDCKVMYADQTIRLGKF